MTLLPWLRSVGLAAIVTMAGPALAQDVKAGALTIKHPWSRATPAGATTAVGYLVIDNAGDTPDRLIAATVEAAATASPHSMSTEGGVMKMRALPEGIIIPAKGEVALKPGALHLMFEGLKHSLKRGESVPGTLTFEKAGTVPVTFEVDAIGATAPRTDMKGMKMD